MMIKRKDFFSQASTPFGSRENLKSPQSPNQPGYTDVTPKSGIFFNSIIHMILEEISNHIFKICNYLIVIKILKLVLIIYIFKQVSNLFYIETLSCLNRYYK